MNNRFTSLLRKELLDAVRDKRSVMAGLYYAFFTPVLLAVVLTAVINKATNPEDIEITITNGIEASNLVNYLSDRGISQGDDPDKLKNIELVISTDFSKQLNRAEPAGVTLIADQSADRLRTAIARIKRALGSYSSEIVSLRLISRGINPNIINPVKVHIQDQATAVSKGGQIMGVMTMLMIFWVVMMTCLVGACDFSSGAVLAPLATSRDLTVGLWASCPKMVAVFFLRSVSVASMACRTPKHIPVCFAMRIS